MRAVCELLSPPVYTKFCKNMFWERGCSFWETVLTSAFFFFSHDRFSSFTLHWLVCAAARNPAGLEQTITKKQNQAIKIKLLHFCRMTQTFFYCLKTRSAGIFQQHFLMFGACWFIIHTKQFKLVPPWAAALSWRITTSLFSVLSLLITENLFSGDKQKENRYLNQKWRSDRTTGLLLSVCPTAVSPLPSLTMGFVVL